MENARILLIEDSVPIQKLVQTIFEPAYRLSVAGTIAEGKQLISEIAFDLVLLDLNLPDGDGLKLLASLKNDQKAAAIPVLVMTGNGETENKVMGFSLGAEDYIMKPFDPIELKARVERRLKAIQGSRRQEETFQAGNLHFNPGMQKVVLMTDKENEIPLTPLEFKLLYHFARHEEHVLSREQLINAVWGNGVHILDRTIDTHVSNLRKKIAGAHHEIRSVHGVGYSFKKKSVISAAA